jgi:hypothetical protein
MKKTQRNMEQIGTQLININCGKPSHDLFSLGTLTYWETE